MTKVHNFSAGPSILSPYAIDKSIKDLQNFENTNLSVLEVSHRSKEFEAVMDNSLQLVKDLLNVPNNYDIIFMQGGASTQFFQIPHNFLRTSASYTDTGVWASGAIKEAKGYGNVHILASGKDINYTAIEKNIEIPLTDDYFHFTSNNTIYGAQLQETPNSPISLICDMSSDIFSKPIDVSKYDLIYAGAQKNMGPAGVTLLIVNKNLYGKRADRFIPSMLNYELIAEKGSMYNTPPCFPILVSMHNMQWMKDLGGVSVMQERNEAKAAALYNAIDNSPYFRGTVAKEDRSRMNVCFVMENGFEAHENAFMDLANKANISGIKGHRSVGGFRASIYNAMELSSVEVLSNLIINFKP